MIRAKPATKSGELSNNIGEMVISSVSYLDGASFTMRALQREVQTTAKVDAIGAGIAWSTYFMAIGDRDEAVRHARNVRALGQPGAAAVCSFIAESNLGYFSRAAEMYPTVADIRLGEASPHMTMGLISASFRGVIACADACKAAKIHLDDEHACAVEIAMRAVAVLERLGVTETDVQAMLDVAGEVLREQRLFWLGALPTLRMLNDSEGAGLLYELVLGVSPERANELTDLMLLRIVERQLDKPGIAISFLSDPQAEVAARHAN